ncbi:MAG: gliding motility protein [Polyangiaceae bacterium]|nr:gliding motility protein [Polyangiaceae bacterium]MBK8942845.1 gliding motility protein [Polyangiaceae bacterium]
MDEVLVGPETKRSLPPPAAPEANDFVKALVPGVQRARPVRRLHDKLARLDPRAELLDREEALVDVSRWVRGGGDVPALPGAQPLESGPIRRFRMLVEALAQFPALRERFARVAQSLIAEQSAEQLFARLGIPGDRGMLTETIDRLSRRLMPQPIDEQDITQLVARMFPARRDATWLSSLPPEVVARFIELLKSPELEGGASEGPRERLPSRGDLPLGAMPSTPDSRGSLPSSMRTASVFVPLRAALLDAILLLASRVSSAGLSDDIRARSPATRSLSESPFFRLPRIIDALLATPRHDLDEIAAWTDEVRLLVGECRDASAAVQARLEVAGVSVDVVYRLELIERSLRRIELLLEVLVPQEPILHAKRCLHMVALLLEERRRDLSLTDIVRTNTRLLARKVIERAGQTGEHYITATPGEFIKMFFSAAGGGILTAGTAAAKTFIGNLHRPPLQEGLLAATNYAGSFMTMQLLGFTLATKQPGMTGAALAGALKDGGTDYEAVVTTIARLARSQLAAAAGNVLMVIPACWAVDRYWMATRGVHFLDAAYAEKTLKSFHPTQSGTIAYAAMTGVILWLSSLAAGWLENWAVYRRLPEAIAEHRARRLLGARITGWASRFFARNIAGFGGNVAIGFMLGLLPIIGAFAGAPLDVRHVTLSTGSLTLAVTSLGSEAISGGPFRAAVLGIFVILVLNLSVSFSLAFGMALRAREVSLVQALRLFVAVVVGFFKSPLRFFLPVGEKGAAPAHGHH